MGSQRRVSSGRRGKTVEREVTLSWQASFHGHWGLQSWGTGERAMRLRLLLQPAMQETWVQSLGWEDPLEKEGIGNPLQYSCLENSMDRGAWWATVHGVSKSGTRLSD